jgi:5-methylcytosine-specific restriction endonuclease McrA
LSNYFKLLEDPRWFKKRDKILNRDNYQCTVCGVKKNLRVHHTFYYKIFTPPWNYPNNSLLTICDSCHEFYHKTHELVIVNKKPKRKFEKKVKRKNILKRIEWKEGMKKVNRFKEQDDSWSKIEQG